MDLSERGASTSRHPWETARARFFVRVLDDHGLLRPGTRILDVGAGDGFVSAQVRERAAVDIALWDLNYSRAEIDAFTARGFSASTSKPAGPFDVALLLDVAEHVVDDRALLSDTLSVLAPGAHVLFSVPAWPLLKSSHDVALKHQRRYTPRAARRLLDDARLDVVEGGGLFHALIAPRIAEIARDRLRANGHDASENGTHGVGGWSAGPIVTNAINAVLDIEGRVSRAFSTSLSKRNVDVPGLSWWALAVRRSS